MPSLASHRHIRTEQRRFRRAKEGRAWFVKDLPQYYYHRNFTEITNAVETSLTHLLDDAAASFLSDFQKLTFPAQCAYIRMCGRKGTVFNIERFNYPEIEDLSNQYQRLAEHGFVSRVGAQEYQNYLYSLTKHEIIEMLSTHVDGHKFRKSWKKDQLIEVALQSVSFQNIALPDSLWAQSRIEPLNYVLFLHSGSTEDSLQKQTLRDLGLVKTPKTTTHYGTQFDTAAAAQTAWFYARGLRNFRLNNDAALSNMIEIIENWPAPRCSQSSVDRDKLLHRLGGLKEREGVLDTALDLYSRSDSALCNEREIRLRYKAGDKTWVKNRLEALIENPCSDAEHAFAEDFYGRKFHKKRTSVVTDILRDAETLELDEAFRHQTEQVVLKYYQLSGSVCFRTENTPWRNLFGVMFWDELFATPNDLRQPSSIKSGDFYDQNTTAIEAKLSELNDRNRAMIKLLKTISLNFDRPQKFVNWRTLSVDRIRVLLETSPPNAVASILRLMAKDWHGTKDGFPDLMVVENNTCRFVEVKAEGDVIRRNQLTRIKQMKSAGFAADIVRVKWIVDTNQTYVVVDVETTGGRPGLHRVTEIGAVKIKNGKVVDQWSSLINPQRSIPANITRITGITEEMVIDAPIFLEVADSFSEFMGDAIFAAHNVNFDYGFISAEFKMIDRKFRHPKICTCSSMRKLYPGHPSYSLKNLCKAFQIDLKSHHRALCDAKAAAELLFLINEKRTEQAN